MQSLNTPQMLICYSQSNQWSHTIFRRCSIVISHFSAQEKHSAYFKPSGPRDYDTWSSPSLCGYWQLSLSSQNKNAVVIWYHDSLELHQNFLLAMKNDFQITQMQSIPALINFYNQKLKPDRLIIQSSWVICKILY